MKSKKFYWLKLMDDFFDRREIRKMRMIAGGDKYLIIYLKMQLHSLKHDGQIIFEGTEEDIYEQLALEIDENVNDIKITISFLVSNKMCVILETQVIEMLRTQELIGVETQWAKYKRDKRQLLENVQDNSNSDIDLSKVSPTDIDLEKEKERELHKEREPKNKSGNGMSTISRPSPDLIPSISQISEYLKSKDIKESKLDFTASKFFNYYEARGWMTDGRPIFDWKALINYWLEIQVNRSQNGYTGKKVAPVPEWLAEFEELLEKGN